MNTNPNVQRDDRTNEERQAEFEQNLAAKPIEQRTEILAKHWQVTREFALRFLQLEAQVAALKS